MKAITVKYLGPTNRRGSRLKAYDCDGNSATISFPYEVSRDIGYLKAAMALVAKMEWDWTPEDLAHGGVKDGEVFVFVENTKKGIL